MIPLRKQQLCPSSASPGIVLSTSQPEQAHQGWNRLTLLRRGLVSAVSELRRGVNPFEIDFLQGLSTRVGEH